jgi:hypothetical protein
MKLHHAMIRNFKTIAGPLEISLAANRPGEARPLTTAPPVSTLPLPERFFRGDFPPALATSRTRLFMVTNTNSRPENSCAV